MLRILINLLIILSIFMLPAYISVILILFSIIIVNDFIEAVIWAILIDVLYGGGSIFGLHFAYFFTAVVLVCYLSSFKIKSALRLSF